MITTTYIEAKHLLCSRKMRKMMGRDELLLVLREIELHMTQIDALIQVVRDDMKEVKAD